ncbi:hypothetical protein ACE8EZ_20080, partial [Pantoea deleyi]|uniref:hypothetical protein n=1 Tax=Pantoea deleyi TaxID=470932 RepID=UPI0035D4A1B8
KSPFYALKKIIRDTRRAVTYHSDENKKYALLPAARITFRSGPFSFSLRNQPVRGFYTHA